MKPVLVLLFLALAAAGAQADVPLQVAAPGLRAPNDPHVNGIRFGFLEAHNRTIRGLDLGLFSFSETGSLLGVRSVIGVGRLGGNLRGVAMSIVNLHSGRDRGVNAAALNQIHAMERGVNLGAVNLVDDYSMVDIGGLNISERSTAQFGVINMTDRIEAVQLGFLNFAENGFLPIFPFFNFPRN